MIQAALGLGLGLGRSDEACRELAELDDPARAKATLDVRLSAVLEDQPPGDDVERLVLAGRAYQKARYAASARLYNVALANNPNLRDGRQAQPRSKAACAAAPAGSGRGKDDPPADEAAKAKLRRQGLDWLRAELVAWAKILDAGPAEIKPIIAPTLLHWKADADLAVIRDETELDKLPEAERAAFRQLWNDVDRLLTKEESLL